MEKSGSCSSCPEREVAQFLELQCPFLCISASLWNEAWCKIWWSYWLSCSQVAKRPLLQKTVGLCISHFLWLLYMKRFHDSCKCCTWQFRSCQNGLTRETSENRNRETRRKLIWCCNLRHVGDSVGWWQLLLEPGNVSSCFQQLLGRRRSCGSRCWRSAGTGLLDPLTLKLLNRHCLN